MKFVLLLLASLLFVASHARAAAFTNAYGFTVHSTDRSMKTTAQFHQAIDDISSYDAILQSHAQWLRAPEYQPEKAATITRAFQAIFGAPPSASALNSWMGAYVGTETYRGVVESNRNWNDFYGAP